MLFVSDAKNMPAMKRNSIVGIVHCIPPPISHEGRVEGKLEQESCHHNPSFKIKGCCSPIYMKWLGCTLH